MPNSQQMPESPIDKAYRVADMLAVRSTRNRFKEELNHFCEWCRRWDRETLKYRRVDDKVQAKMFEAITDRDTGPQTAGRRQMWRARLNRLRRHQPQPSPWEQLRSVPSQLPQGLGEQQQALSDYMFPPEHAPGLDKSLSVCLQFVRLAILHDMGLREDSAISPLTPGVLDSSEVECTYADMTAGWRNSVWPAAIDYALKAVENELDKPDQRPNVRGQPSETAPSGGAQVEAMDKAAEQITAEAMIKSKEEQGKYDVFLSHNSKDKAAVEEIAKRLKSVGIRAWLDKWDVIAGETVMEALENAITNIKCAALFFGPADVGRWHVMEIRACIESKAAGKARFIPVILPGVKNTPELPMFVRQALWVDMREWKEEGNDAFDRLVCGIIERPPGELPAGGLTARDVFEWQNRCR